MAGMLSTVDLGMLKVKLCSLTNEYRKPTYAHIQSACADRKVYGDKRCAHVDSQVPAKVPASERPVSDSKWQKSCCRQICHRCAANVIYRCPVR